MEAESKLVSNRSSAQPRTALSGLRVALVHDWITGMRGGEKCLEVLCRLFPEAQLFTLLHQKGSASPTIERMSIRTSPLQLVPGISKHYRYWLPLMPTASRFWRVGEVDLVFSLSHCAAKAVRVPQTIPHVCYCFTPMRYAWQTRDKYLDRLNRKPVRSWLARTMLDRMREWDRSVSSGVDHFIGISQTVCKRIEDCYGRSSRLIAPPVDTEFYTPGEVERNGAYLCVSALVPYKRIDHAVAACTKLGLPLVVIGGGPEQARLEASAGPTVKILGRQSDETIRDHLRTCRALLFPGEEDFGIVPIEALACGAPVIALGRGGAAETIDQEVGMLYEDESPEGLEQAILEWESLGRPCDSAEARRKAEAFAAPLFEQRIVDMLVEVAGKSTRESGLRGPHAGVPRSVQRRFRQSRSGSRPA